MLLGRRCDWLPDIGWIFWPAPYGTAAGQLLKPTAQGWKRSRSVV